MTDHRNKFPRLPDDPDSFSPVFFVIAMVLALVISLGVISVGVWGFVELVQWVTSQ